MVRRLLLGLLLGLVVGGLAAAGVVAGLKVPEFVGTGGALLAYAVAALTGVLTGLVAGKPIWASGAKIEAGLKATFGALLAAGLMFALRQWAGAWTIDLTSIGAGQGAVGALPGASLPLLAAVLGGFFELDNTDSATAGPKAPSAPNDRKRIASQVSNGRGKAREMQESEESDDVEVAAKHAKR